MTRRRSRDLAPNIAWIALGLLVCGETSIQGTARGVLERPYTVGGGGVPPHPHFPPLQNPPPPSNTSLGTAHRASWIAALL